MAPLTNRTKIRHQKRLVLNHCGTGEIGPATAEAESIRIQSQALSNNAALVELEAVRKWNGILPQYMMGDTIPFINLK